MQLIISPFLLTGARALLHIKESLTSKSEAEYLLIQLGWKCDLKGNDLNEVRGAFKLTDSLTKIKKLVEDLRYERYVDVTDTIRTLVSTLKQIYKAISDFVDFVAPVQPSTIALLNDSAFWQAMATDLIPYLLVRELKKAEPAIYTAFFIAGAIQEVEVIPTGDNRLPYTRVILDWNALKRFLSNPVRELADHYNWNTNQPLKYNHLLHDLNAVASLFPITPYINSTPAAIARTYYEDDKLEEQQIASFILPFISGIKPDGSGEVELGLSLTPIPKLPLSVGGSGQVPEGFLLAPYIHGSNSRTIALDAHLTLAFTGRFATDNAFELEILPGVVKFKTAVGATASNAELRLTNKPKEPIRFFGSENSSRLELSGYSIVVEVTGTIANPELIVKAGTGPATGTEKLTLHIMPGEGDSFISKIFDSNPIKVDAAGFITWSSRTGLGIDGKLGLHMHSTENKQLGPVFLQGYDIEISSQIEAPLVANATINFRLELGPVTATVEKFGLSFKLVNNQAGEKGLLDNVDVAWGIKTPTGIGIKVDSDTIKGGGYLSIDSAAHRYAGVANLTFRDKLTLTAVGILQTELPNNQLGYSLLLLITAQFKPIQLGLGFTLSGVGGLVGINRTVDVNYLRGQVQSGNMDKLLFPTNVLDNVTDVLTRVDSSFPAAEGRYVFGLMAKIGWGTPTLITLDVALIIELPKPERYIILGVLQAILPNKDHQLIRLRADFLGEINFGSKKISFDASLSDSRILDFIFTGDAAFRLYQGDNPVFILAAGGFNINFQPPPNADLTKLRRLTLTFANSDDLKVILTSYLAVTSNTVQFGSRLDLYLKLKLGYYVEGFAGFDVLFQFHPFHVEANVGASMAIKRDGKTKLGISLSLNVSGPAPWHVVGEANFTIGPLSFTARINRTFGRGSVAQSLPAIDVYILFKQALQDPKSWEVEEPATGSLASVVLKAPAGNTSTLLIDPNGALVLRQRLVPLRFALEKFGSNSVINGNRFDITHIQVLDAAPSGRVIDVGSNLDAVKDFFAPEQFRKMTDAQKLSSPSFQLMESGRRLSGLARFTSVPGTRRVVEYEDLILPAHANPGGSLVDDDSLRATAGIPIDTSVVTKPPLITPGLYKKLARNSAIGRAYRQQQPSARVPEAVQWSEDEYAVVNDRDLNRIAGSPASFANEALATQWLKEHINDNLGLKGELLVVPVYQLD